MFFLIFYVKLNTDIYLEIRKGYKEPKGDGDGDREVPIPIPIPVRAKNRNEKGEGWRLPVLILASLLFQGSLASIKNLTVKLIFLKGSNLENGQSFTLSTSVALLSLASLHVHIVLFLVSFFLNQIILVTNTIYQTINRFYLCW